MNEDTNIPLRERKFAQTKLALLKVAIEKMKMKPLEAISVKELCEATMISEMTFYKYFPKKTDLLVYYLQVVVLEIAWYLQHGVKSKTNLEMVEECFDLAIRKMFGNLSVMSETIAYFAQERELPEFQALSKAEQMLEFPHLPGIEEVQLKDARLETLVEPYLRQAVADGELPATTDVNTLLIMAVAIFTGLVMHLHLSQPELVRPLCRKQLQLLWKALRTEPDD